MTNKNERIRQKIIFFVFCSLAFSCSWESAGAQTFTCQKVVDNGDIYSKIDVFILGNDIQPSDFTAFTEKQIDKNVTGIGFFSVEPFKTYKDRFNFYTLTPETKTATFSSRVEVSDVMVQRFKQIAAQYCSVNESNVDYMVVDTYKDSSSHAFGFAYPLLHIAFVKTPSASDDMADYVEEFLHEFGHSFASFGEEYRDYGSPGIINLNTEGCPKWCSGAAIDSSSPYYQYYKEWSDCAAGVKAGAQQMTLPNGLIQYIFTSAQRTALNSCYHTPAKKLWDAKKEILMAVNLGTDCMAGAGCYLHMPDDIYFRQTYGSLMGKGTFGLMLLMIFHHMAVRDGQSINFGELASFSSYIQSSDYQTVLDKYYSAFASEMNTYGPYSEQYLKNLIESATSFSAGWLDLTDCDYFYGWAGDFDNLNQPVEVRFYSDGVAGIGKYIGNTTANTQRAAAVCEALGGSTNNCSVCPSDQPQCKHGFIFPVPSSLEDGGTHSIYAYGINLPGTAGSNTLLSGSPKRIGNLYGWLDSANCSYFTGWAGDPRNPNQSVNVQFYVDGSLVSGGFVNGTTANTQRAAAVCEALGGSTNNCSVCPSDQPQCKHGFVFTVPPSLKDGKAHTINAYGLTLQTEGLLGHGACSILLSGSAKTISCPIIHRADTSEPYNCISNTELDAFIGLWKVDSFDPTLKELMEAIGLWKKGC